MNAMPKLVVLWTDAVMWALVASLAAYFWHAARSPNLRATWSKVLRDAPALCALVVFALFAAVALLDSVHFRRALPTAPGAAADAPVFHATRTESLLDLLLARPIAMRETTYSKPLAAHGFTKETVEVDGVVERRLPRLDHAGRHLGDLARRTAAGLAGGLAVAGLATLLVAGLRARRYRVGVRVGVGVGASLADIAANRTELPLRC